MINKDLKIDYKTMYYELRKLYDELEYNHSKLRHFFRRDFLRLIKKY